MNIFTVYCKKTLKNKIEKRPEWPIKSYMQRYNRCQDTQGTLKEGIPFKHGLLVNMASNYLGFIFL